MLYNIFGEIKHLFLQTVGEPKNWSGLRQLQCLPDPLEQFRHIKLLKLYFGHQSFMVCSVLVWRIFSSNHPESAGVAIGGPVEDLVWICPL